MGNDLEELETPVLLAAMPQILDPFFHQSVVLLVHHDPEGSLGFIVNRTTGIDVSEILDGLDMTWGGDDAAATYFGGPVQPQLGSVLFDPADRPDLVDLESTNVVADGLAVSQSLEALAALTSEPPERFRLLLGYAGWGEEQLLGEILRNDWITVPPGADLVFTPDPDATWAATLRSVGVDPESLPAWTGSGDGEPSAN